MFFVMFFLLFWVISVLSDRLVLYHNLINLMMFLLYIYDFLFANIMSNINKDNQQLVGLKNLQVCRSAKKCTS